MNDKVQGFWNDIVTRDSHALAEGMETAELNQSAKADSGKPRLSLVPASLERAVCSIREYGCVKYHDPDNWKRVEPQRYFEAMLRHTNAMREHGIYSLDEESGLPHLHHLACSIAFLIEFQNMEQQ